MNDEDHHSTKCEMQDNVIREEVADFYMPLGGAEFLEREDK